VRDSKEVYAHELDLAKPFLTQRDRKRTVHELMEGLRADFERRGKASPQNLSNIRRVQEDFGAWRALALDAKDVDEYIENRLASGSQPSSINRNTQLLKQAYTLAELPAPKIPRLSEEGNTRRGFFSDSPGDRKAQKADLRPFVVSDYF